jgi:hypothetical protein
VDRSILSEIGCCGSRCGPLLTVRKKEECHGAIAYVYGVQAGWEAGESKMRNFS